MSAILAIAEREIVERKALLYVVLACSLGNLALLLAPGLAVGEPSLLDVASATLGVALPAGLALGVGASVIGRDLAERRLSFYFSRPFSGFAIWAGKTLGGLIPVLLATLLCTGSVIFVNDDISRWFWARAIVLTTLLFLIAQVASALYRSPSLSTVLDVIALGVVILGVASAGRALQWIGAETAIERAVPWGLGVAMAALALAGGAFVTVGRGDPGRGHRAASFVLWTCMGVAVCAAHGYARWVADVHPTGTANMWPWDFNGSPNGEVLLLAGTSEGRAGFSPAFWMDARSGRYSIARGVASQAIVFSRDGQKAYGISGSDDDQQLSIFDLTSASVDERRVGLSSPNCSFPLAVSPRGTRLVVLCGERSRVVETATGRTVSEVPFGFGLPENPFVDEDALRTCWGGREKSPTCRDWRASTGEVATGPAFDGPARVVDQQGARVLVWSETSKTLALVDGPPGHATMRLLPGLGETSALLHDGAIVSVSGAGEGAVAISWISADGSPSPGHVVNLGSDSVQVVGEPVPGQIALATLGGPSAEIDFRPGIAFFDVETGRLVRSEPDLRAIGIRRWIRDAGVGSLGTRLFLDPSGRLILRDPETGSRRVLIDAAAQ